MCGIPEGIEGLQKAYLSGHRMELSEDIAQGDLR